MDNILKLKNEQRALILKKRKEIKKKENLNFINLEEKLLEIFEYEKVNIIATFIEINTEISMQKLNNYLIQTSKTICLPVIEGNNNHLIFREFNKKTELLKGKFGVLEPSKKSKEVYPDLILTPCLAFDLFGYRLGYGGGYYDKTFNRFHNSNHLYKSVAIAFDDQKVNKVVKNNLDYKVNYVLTDQQIYKIL
tara:strand:+ start:646 stop:1224 length:579 start_codon:yes stop_codon:yes gene_type:complete